MTRSSEAAAQAAKIAELKNIIKSGTFESLEKLEEAVDAFLWGDEEDEAAEVYSFDPLQHAKLAPK